MGANGDHGPAGPIAGNDRIVRVLDALVTQSRTGGWGVRELAGMITESRSTVNRVLQGLVQRRLASVEGNGAYVVGPRLRVLADALHERHPVLREAPAIISELAGQCEATTAVVMHGPGPTTAFVCVLHEHAGPVRYGIRPGMILPLHAGSAGRAVLSALGLEALDGVALDQFTQDTVVDRQQLAEELDRAARDGFVTSVGQHIPLAAGVAAPFVTASGEVAAVSATRPRYSTTDEDLARLGPLVRDAAARLSALPPSVPDRGPIGTRTTDGTALGRFERLLDILVAQPAGITAGRDLTARIGARPATTTKLRTTAETTGITRTTADGRIAAGPLLLRWAAVLGTRAPLADLVADDLAELAAETGETSGLTVFDSATATAVLQATVPGPDPVRYELDRRTRPAPRRRGREGHPRPLPARGGGEAKP